MDKVLLIDGFNAFWRANVSFGKKINHAPCSIETFDGKCFDHLKTNAHCVCGATWDEEKQTCFAELYVIVFNFFRNLRPIIEMFNPDKCFVVLEGHSKFRYELFPKYKANRIIKLASKQEDHDKFDRQKDIIVELLKYLPVTIAYANDYECDDVIATLAQSLPQESVTVLSGDNDFIQLLQICKNVQVYSPIKKEFMMAPEYHYVAWKCLNGDKSDNIPNLLGEKTALKTILDPEKFEKFMALEENRANFTINRQLIEFQSVPLDDIIITEGTGDWVGLKSEFEKMEFNSITNEKSWKKYVNTFSCIKF